MTAAALKLDNIKRVFDVGSSQVHALKGISFDVPEGQFMTIMGASGSGKTTLLNILGGMDLATSGIYLLDGVNLEGLSRRKLAFLRNQKIGFVFQSFNLLSRTTALENVELPLLYRAGIPRKERRERAAQALKTVGLEDRMDHHPNQLSGGQQQRVAIARALVTDPVLLLADEATGNLDSHTSHEIMHLFQDLNSQGKTIVFVTHEDDIAAYSQRTITLRDGLIIRDQSRTKEEISS